MKNTKFVAKLCRIATVALSRLASRFQLTILRDTQMAFFKFPEEKMKKQVKALVTYFGTYLYLKFKSKRDPRHMTKRNQIT